MISTPPITDNGLMSILAYTDITCGTKTMWLTASSNTIRLSQGFKQQAAGRLSSETVTRW
jgi:hypothetical protein